MTLCDWVLNIQNQPIHCSVFHCFYLRFPSSDQIICTKEEIGRNAMNMIIMNIPPKLLWNGKAAAVLVSTLPFLAMVRSFWLTWKFWVCVVISVSQLSRVAKLCNFLRHYKRDKRSTLHEATSQWAVPVHSTFSDLDHISQSQHCQTILAEHFLFLSS